MISKDSVFYWQNAKELADISRHSRLLKVSDASPKARWGHTSVAAQNRLFIIGGYEGKCSGGSKKPNSPNFRIRRISNVLIQEFTSTTSGCSISCCSNTPRWKSSRPFRHTLPMERPNLKSTCCLGPTTPAFTTLLRTGKWEILFLTEVEQYFRVWRRPPPQETI